MLPQSASDPQSLCSPAWDENARLAALEQYAIIDSGREPDHARAAKPDLPVLLVSGYAEHEGIEPTLPRLTKPFRADELAALLSALMTA